MQYLRVHSFNSRQGTSKVKTRSEVRGGGKKPWKQKGTGRARAGSSRSPLWVGGGVVHGPQPKNWAKKITQKMRSKAFKNSISVKLSDDSFLGLICPGKDKKISTKSASEFLKSIKIENGNILIIHSGNDYLYKSFRNLKSVKLVDVGELSTYDILSAAKAIVEKSALEKLNKRL